MRWIIVVVAVALSGCAGYSIQEKGRGVGYDVYRPEPYLQGAAQLDTAGKVAAYNFTLIWLPNYSKRYRVHSWAGLGTANFTFQYSEGWKLTNVTDASSNTNILTEIVGLVKHLIPANPVGIGAKASDVNTFTDLPTSPLLYKIDIDECTGRVCLHQVMVGEATCSSTTPMSSTPAKPVP